MSGRIKDAIVDFAAFSSQIARVGCALARSFLVRNWCGARLVAGLGELFIGPLQWAILRKYRLAFLQMRRKSLARVCSGEAENLKRG
jgi:hypothetical protein